MTISLDALRVVCAVVNEGGVNRAARVLNRVPSAVSHAIRKLERDLDAEIFRRQGRRLVLTEAGARLVRDGQDVLRQTVDLEAAVRRIHEGWTPELRIAVGGAVPMPWVLDLVEGLYAVSPHTQITIQREVLAGSWDALVANRVDLVVGVARLWTPCSL